MKKKFLVLFIGLGLILILCLSAISTKNNADPEILYRNNNSIDLLAYERTAFVNATQIDWISEIILTKGILLGEITGTRITKNFRDFDATYLEVGTKIYSVFERNDIILAEKNGELFPYYKFVEG